MYIVWFIAAARTVVCSTLPLLLFFWLSKSHNLKKLAAIIFAMGSTIFEFSLPVLGRSKDVFHETLRMVSRTGVMNAPLITEQVFFSNKLFDRN